MVAGLVFLTGATALICVGSNIALLIVGRLLQGTSAALVWTIGLALIVDTVDGPKVGSAMGWIGAAMTMAILVSPILGGVVYRGGGYYAAFAMCFGLIAVDIGLRFTMIEVKMAQKWLDNTEQLDAEAPTLAALQDPNSEKTQNTNEKQSVAVGGDLNSTLVTEPHPTASSKSKIPPILLLLRSPRLLAALWGTLIHAMITTSFDSTLPLLVSSLFGWSSIGAGLIFLPLLIPSFLSPVIGAASDRYGPKWFAAGGFLLATPFLICLRFVTENNIQQKVLLCAMLTGVGLGMALVLGPLTAEITWVVQEEKTSMSAPVSAVSAGTAEARRADAIDDTEDGGIHAQAYALYNMAFSGGALLGPIMGGLIQQHAGWGTFGWSLAILTFATAVVQAIWVGKARTLSVIGFTI